MLKLKLVTEDNVAFVQEKLFSCTIALLIILSLTPKGVGDAYLILGHAHFMMTALYQYKAGRLTPTKLVVYAISLIALFNIAHMFPQAFTLFASAFLLIHVFSGEIRHFKREYTLPYFLMTLSLMTILCAWLSIELWNVEINVTKLSLFVNIIVLFSCFSYYRDRKSQNFDAFMPFLVIFYVFFVMLEYTGMRPTSFESFGFIVIAHYMSTYFNVTKSFERRNPQKAAIFIKESLLMNSAFLAGYIVVFYIIGTYNNPLYTYVYQPITFYVWTVMHFLTTWNNQEYKNVFKRAYA